MALRILQENEITKESGNKKSAFTEVIKNKKGHIPEIPQSVSPSPLSNTKILEYNNMYDVLTIEDDSEATADNDQASKRQIPDADDDQASTKQNTQKYDDQEMSAVNSQTKGDGQQHARKDTDSQPAEKVNAVNSESPEANAHRANQSTKQFSLIIGDSMIKNINPQKL